MKIIALYSDRPGSGKTTVARVLAQYGYVRLPLAAPIKRLVVIFLQEAGVSMLRANDYVYENKEEIIPEVGCTARHLMQTLGTEWGRDCIDENIWTKLWEFEASQLHPDSKIVVDDLRFPSEWEFLEMIDADFWRIDRPSTALRKRDRVWSLLRRLLWVDQGHSSECGLGWFTPDVEIINNGTLDELAAQVQTVLEWDITDHDWEDE